MHEGRLLSLLILVFCVRNEVYFQLHFVGLFPICWERAVPLTFHLCCFYFSAVLIVGVPFPFGV